jgi:N-acetylglutamate synthase-like GNAT family acetyltransferase
VDGGIVGVVRLALEEGALVLRGMRLRADMRRRRIGTQLLDGVVAALGSQKCYCIPYRWLISFYAQGGFVMVRPDEVPPFLLHRYEKYLRDGLNVVMMCRHRP